MLEEILAGVGVSVILEVPLVPCLLQCLLDPRCLPWGIGEAPGVDHSATPDHRDDNGLHNSRDMLESSVCLSAEGVIFQRDSMLRSPAEPA